jgi:hypothetical protein
LQAPTESAKADTKRSNFISAYAPKSCAAASQFESGSQTGNTISP